MQTRLRTTLDPNPSGTAFDLHTALGLYNTMPSTRESPTRCVPAKTTHSHIGVSSTRRPNSSSIPETSHITTMRNKSRLFVAAACSAIPTMRVMCGGKLEGMQLTGTYGRWRHLPIRRTALSSFRQAPDARPSIRSAYRIAAEGGVTGTATCTNIGQQIDQNSSCVEWATNNRD